jgi:hypothetical protein
MSCEMDPAQWIPVLGGRKRRKEGWRRCPQRAGHHSINKYNQHHLFIDKTTPIIKRDRDSLVYKAKLAEQAERFDEMVSDMKEVARQPQELTVEGRCEWIVSLALPLRSPL